MIIPKSYQIPDHFKFYSSIILEYQCNPGVSTISLTLYNDTTPVQTFQPDFLVLFVVYCRIVSLAKVAICWF